MNRLFKKLFGSLATLAIAIGFGIATVNQPNFIGTKAADYTIVFDSSGSFSTSIADGPISTLRYTAVNSGSSTLTATYAKNASTTTTIFNNSSGEIRLYGGNGNGGQITFTLSEGLFTRIDVSLSQNNGLSINGGSSQTALSIQETFSARDSVVVKNVASSTSQIRITEITLYYSTGGEAPVFGNLSGITLDTTSPTLKKAYYVGESFSSQGLIVTAFDDSEPAIEVVVTEYSVDKKDYVFLNADIGTVLVTVTVEINSIIKTNSYYVTVSAAPAWANFTKVESISGLHLGATYILAGFKDADLFAMSTTQNSNNRGSLQVSLNAGKIIDAENIQKFELVKGSSLNSYAFKTINGTANEYIFAAGGTSSNYLRSSTTLDGNGSWQITFSSGTTIAAQGSSSRNYMRFNASNNPPVFASYASTSSVNILVDLYLDETTIAANAFSSAYNLAYDVNVGLGLGSEGNCETTLDLINARYLGLSSEAKTEFDNNSTAEFINAKARINYLSTWVSNNSVPTGIRNNTSNDTINSTLIIGIIGISSLFGYYFVSKKRIH